MHASSLENMRKCYRRYIAGSKLEKRASLKVLDVGGADVNGSYSDVFSGANVEYLGTDLQPGEGVSVVLDDPGKLPLENDSIDVVISGQMLEHCEFFWVVFAEMVRVVKPDGFIFLIAPSAGPIHYYPVDCYRFYPDAYRALAKHADCHLIDVWHDKRGPWNDLVGVFNKSGVAPDLANEPDLSLTLAANATADIKPTPYEQVQGEVLSIDVLRNLHELLKPRHYLEIGVRHGKSLSLASCEAVGVDPAPDVDLELPAATRVIEQTSDDFFEDAGEPILNAKPDLVFIDGMHLFEYTLRDFMNVERICGPNTVVAIDDVFPNHPNQASRTRRTRVWTGDVWKLHRALTKHRPDLCLIPLDTNPTGLLLILGLDPKNQVLWQRYNPIVREAVHDLDAPGKEVLERRGALSPDGETLQRCFGILARAKSNGLSFRSQRRALTQAMNAGRPLSGAQNRRPRLSVVVVAYNMARELPRTLKSLSPLMQSGITENEYEIIIVDNGSSEPVDLQQCQSISSNVVVLRREPGCPSPAVAINEGIASARGDLIGVMIDGARMASPGLLKAALDAAQVNANAVIGTLAFHLGNDTQMQAVKTGYNQTVEDRLLASVDWQSDGYRLFDISVFAGSSAKGWFEVPHETNAIFMNRRSWQKLGGYDEKFQQPGGGLVNLDTWHRACNDEENQIVMLLGEATFHQFHQGIATNSTSHPWRQFAEEYAEIRGRSYEPPKLENVTYFGKIRSNQKRSVLSSAYQSVSLDDPLDHTGLQHNNRAFRSNFPPPLLSEIQEGVMNTLYRGVPFFKSPFDIGVYLQLLSKQKTRTIIEIGSNFGGSALWFADMLSASGVSSPKVVSIDIEPRAQFADDRIEFLKGDAAQLGPVLSEDFINELPRPLTVIEDSSHHYEHSLAVLEFFHEFLQTGDYIIVEDGVVSQFPGQCIAGIRTDRAARYVIFSMKTVRITNWMRNCVITTGLTARTIPMDISGGYDLRVWARTDL